MATLTSQLVIELLDRVTSPARQAASALAGISTRIRENNGMPMTFGNRLNAAITRNNRSLAAARGGLVDAAASFYALREAIGGPIAAASAFESAMADVRKVVDFPTPEGFAQFQQDLFALSRDIPIAVTGLAEIAAAAGQAGIAGQDLIRFTDAAARIGVAFDISADQAGASMANLMTALGLTIDETVSLADAMNHLSNSQASSAADILDVVRRVGAQATLFGFSAEETSAFASAMLAAGAQSEVAATSFRNMGAALTRGSAATRAQREAFQELGLDAEAVARRMQEDAVGTTLDVLRRISQIPREQQAAISSQLFGNEARALGPLLTNLGLVEDTLGMVGDRANYAGSAFAEFEARNNTFQANMQRFQNVLTELQVNIGNALMPAITSLAEAITPLILRISELAAAYPEVTLAVVGATAAVIAFKGAMSALQFAGLLGRGGVLSMIAAGYNTIGRAAKVGTHTDSADLEIDDTDGRIVLPQIGAPVSIALGWESEGLRVVFEGTVDEVKSSGTRSAGRRLRITAKGMDTTGRAKEGQQRHWDGATVETILRDAATHAGISQIEIDPALRNLTRGYFEMRDESLIAMGERLAREIGGNFRVTGGRIVLSKRNADYATAIEATWGQNLHSWDIAPQLGRPQFGAVRGRWYDVAAGAWQVVERATGIDVPSIYADRFARSGEMETTQQGESDAATTARDAGEGTVVIEGNTAAVPDGLCLVSGTRPGVDGSYRIEAVTHTLTRAGGFVTTLELKQPSQGAGTDPRVEAAAPVAPSANVPPIIDPDATGPF